MTIYTVNVDRCQDICYSLDVTWEQPVGIVEIAARLGVKRQTVDVWRVRGLLPEPKGLVGGRPAWDWPEIEAWARSTARL